MTTGVMVEITMQLEADVTVGDVMNMTITVLALVEDSICFVLRHVYTALIFPQTLTNNNITLMQIWFKTAILNFHRRCYKCISYS